MRRYLATAAMTLFAVAALAQEAPAPKPSIAVIDVDLLVQQSAAGKEAMARLQKMRDEKLAEGKKMQSDLETLQQQLANQQATLTEAKVTELQKQIEDKQITLKRFQDDAQQQLSEAQDKEYSQLNDKMMPVIAEIGKELKLDLIFNKYRSGLLYASDAIDITDQVLRRFNTQVTQ
jgi:outer membrane protein